VRVIDLPPRELMRYAGFGHHLVTGRLMGLWARLPRNVRPVRWVISEREWFDVRSAWMRENDTSTPPTRDGFLIMGIPIRVKGDA
jgi:hypothetical protein